MYYVAENKHVECVCVCVYVTQSMKCALSKSIKLSRYSCFHANFLELVHFRDE